LRAVVSEHSKDNVFYYYLVLFPLSLLPWTGIFFAATVNALRKKKLHHLVYLMVWIAVTLVFYTMMATKYLTYVFPAIFPAALLAGQFLADLQESKQRQIWLYLSLPAVIFIGILMAGTQLTPAVDSWMALYVSSVAAVLVILWLQIRGNAGRLPEFVALATIVISFLFIHNGLIPLAMTRSAKVIAQALPSEGAVVASYGDYATSAVYYSGYTIPKLVNSRAESQARGVWSGKYTMPTETMPDFANRTNNHFNTYVLVNVREEKFSDEFHALLGKQFFVVNNYADMTLYQRIEPNNVNSME
jgi:4-amino-4-deoxy-L-arabinose transferase-like glycosyltransferase